MIRRFPSYSAAAHKLFSYQLAAMGKVPVRLKEVVYMVSPFEVSILISLGQQP